MIFCSPVNQAAMTWSLRDSIRWRDLALFLARAFPGLAIGIALLLILDRTLYTHGLDIFLLSYGTYMLFRKPMVVRTQHAVFDVGCGFLSGIFGGAVGFPSATVMIWCGMKGWDKTRQRAVVRPFILIMQMFALPAIILLGHNRDFDPGNRLFIPASLLGTALGLGLFRRLSDSQFGRLVSVLLIACGAGFAL